MAIISHSKTTFGILDKMSIILFMSIFLLRISSLVMFVYGVVALAEGMLDYRILPILNYFRAFGMYLGDLYFGLVGSLMTYIVLHTVMGFVGIMGDMCKNKCLLAAYFIFCIVSIPAEIVFIVMFLLMRYHVKYNMDDESLNFKALYTDWQSGYFNERGTAAWNVLSQMNNCDTADSCWGRVKYFLADTTVTYIVLASLNIVAEILILICINFKYGGLRKEKEESKYLLTIFWNFLKKKKTEKAVVVWQGTLIGINKIISLAALLYGISLVASDYATLGGIFYRFVYGNFFIPDFVLGSGIAMILTGVLGIFGSILALINLQKQTQSSMSLSVITSMVLCVGSIAQIAVYSRITNDIISSISKNFDFLFRAYYGKVDYVADDLITNDWNDMFDKLQCCIPEIKTEGYQFWRQREHAWLQSYVTSYSTNRCQLNTTIDHTLDDSATPLTTITHRDVSCETTVTTFMRTLQSIALGISISLFITNIVMIITTIKDLNKTIKEVLRTFFFPSEDHQSLSCRTCRTNFATLFMILATSIGLLVVGALISEDDVLNDQQMKPLFRAIIYNNLYLYDTMKILSFLLMISGFTGVLLTAYSLCLRKGSHVAFYIFMMMIGVIYLAAQTTSTVISVLYIHNTRMNLNSSLAEVVSSYYYTNQYSGNPTYSGFWYPISLGINYMFQKLECCAKDGINNNIPQTISACIKNEDFFISEYTTPQTYTVFNNVCSDVLQDLLINKYLAPTVALSIIAWLFILRYIVTFNYMYKHITESECSCFTHIFSKIKNVLSRAGFVVNVFLALLALVTFIVSLAGIRPYASECDNHGLCSVTRDTLFMPEVLHGIVIFLIALSAISGFLLHLPCALSYVFEKFPQNYTSTTLIKNTLFITTLGIVLVTIGDIIFLGFMSRVLNVVIQEGTASYWSYVRLVTMLALISLDIVGKIMSIILNDRKYKEIQTKELETKNLETKEIQTKEIETKESTGKDASTEGSGIFYSIFKKIRLLSDFWMSIPGHICIAVLSLGMVIGTLIGIWPYSIDCSSNSLCDVTSGMFYIDDVMQRNVQFFIFLLFASVVVHSSNAFIYIFNNKKKRTWFRWSLKIENIVLLLVILMELFCLGFNSLVLNSVYREGTASYFVYLRLGLMVTYLVTDVVLKIFCSILNERNCKNTNEESETPTHGLYLFLILFLKSKAETFGRLPFLAFLICIATSLFIGGFLFVASVLQIALPQLASYDSYSNVSFLYINLRDLGYGLTIGVLIAAVLSMAAHATTVVMVMKRFKRVTVVLTVVLVPLVVVDIGLLVIGGILMNVCYCCPGCVTETTSGYRLYDTSQTCSFSSDNFSTIGTLIAFLVIDIVVKISLVLLQNYSFLRMDMDSKQTPNKPKWMLEALWDKSVVSTDIKYIRGIAGFLCFVWVVTLVLLVASILPFAGSLAVYFTQFVEDLNDVVREPLFMGDVANGIFITLLVQTSISFITSILWPVVIFKAMTKTLVILVLLLVTTALLDGFLLGFAITVKEAVNSNSGSILETYGAHGPTLADVYSNVCLAVICVDSAIKIALVGISNQLYKDFPNTGAKLSSVFVQWILERDGRVVLHILFFLINLAMLVGLGIFVNSSLCSDASNTSTTTTCYDQLTNQGLNAQYTFHGVGIFMMCFVSISIVSHLVFGGKQIYAIFHKGTPSTHERKWLLVGTIVFSFLFICDVVAIGFQSRVLLTVHQEKLSSYSIYHILGCIIAYLVIDSIAKVLIIILTYKQYRSLQKSETTNQLSKYFGKFFQRYTPHLAVVTGAFAMACSLAMLVGAIRVQQTSGCLFDDCQTDVVRQGMNISYAFNGVTIYLIVVSSLGIVIYLGTSVVLCLSRKPTRLGLVRKSLVVISFTLFFLILSEIVVFGITARIMNVIYQEPSPASSFTSTGLMLAFLLVDIIFKIILMVFVNVMFSRYSQTLPTKLDTNEQEEKPKWILEYIWDKSSVKTKLVYLRALSLFLVFLLCFSATFLVGLSLQRSGPYASSYSEWLDDVSEVTFSQMQANYIANGIYISSIVTTVLSVIAYGFWATMLFYAYPGLFFLASVFIVVLLVYDLIALIFASFAMNAVFRLSSPTSAYTRVGLCLTYIVLDLLIKIILIVISNYIFAHFPNKGIEENKMFLSYFKKFKELMSRRYQQLQKTAISFFILTCILMICEFGVFVAVIVVRYSVTYATFNSNFYNYFNEFSDVNGSNKGIQLEALFYSLVVEIPILLVLHVLSMVFLTRTIVMKIAIGVFLFIMAFDMANLGLASSLLDTAYYCWNMKYVIVSAYSYRASFCTDYVPRLFYMAGFCIGYDTVHMVSLGILVAILVVLLKRQPKDQTARVEPIEEGVADDSVDRKTVSGKPGQDQADNVENSKITTNDQDGGEQGYIEQNVSQVQQNKQDTLVDKSSLDPRSENNPVEKPEPLDKDKRQENLPETTDSERNVNEQEQNNDIKQNATDEKKQQEPNPEPTNNENPEEKEGAETNKGDQSNAPVEMTEQKPPSAETVPDSRESRRANQESVL